MSIPDSDIQRQLNRMFAEQEKRFAGLEHRFLALLQQMETPCSRSHCRPESIRSVYGGVNDVLSRLTSEQQNTNLSGYVVYSDVSVQKLQEDLRLVRKVLLSIVTEEMGGNELEKILRKW